MHCPAGPHFGATSPSAHGSKSRLRSAFGRATGWRRGDGSTQQSRSLVHGTAAIHVNTQPFAGFGQSQLGPSFTPGRARMFSGTPSVSATHLPAARSARHPRISQVPLGTGGVLGSSVQPPSMHLHSPGGGADSSHADAGTPASTQRVGTQSSSHPQSAAVAHATTDR